MTQHSAQLAIAPETDCCPACQSTSVSSFYSVENVPTNSCILHDNVDDAMNCATGNIRLGFCEDCGFVYNTVFVSEETEYSERYEETQGYSPTFSNFHKQLAQDLIDKHGLKEKNIVEIGCGKGEFLILLSQLGQNKGVGIDPSAISERIKGVPGAERVSLISEYYREDHDMADVDFVACKMTLEHIPDPEVFLKTIRKSLGDENNPIVFFQIPEAKRILKTCAFEDIYYEHCAYFTPGSLSRLFRRCGFEVLGVDTNYDDQYLTIESRPSNGEGGTLSAIEDDMEELRDLVQTFPERVEAMKSNWKAIVRGAKAEGKTIALWGSGSKAVSFLTSLDVGEDVDCVVDINPNRANHYMPITGQKIIAPADLVDAKPDLVVIMNRIYETEITEDLHSRGLFPKVVCL